MMSKTLAILDEPFSTMSYSSPKSFLTWWLSGQEWLSNSSKTDGQNKPLVHSFSHLLPPTTPRSSQLFQTHTKGAKKTENLFSLIKAQFPYWFTVTEDLAKNSYYMTFKDPNGILDHVYFTAEWAIKGPVEGLANKLVADIYVKHPSLIPKPTFVPLIEEKKIEVVVGPDLTKFNNSFQLIGQEMNKLSNIMAGEFKVAMESLKPSLEAMNEFVKLYGLDKSDKVADYALKHEGMKNRHNCPQQGCHWKKYALDRLIVHLNDTHKWKRERIADWLDTLDEQPVFYPAIEGAE